MEPASRVWQRTESRWWFELSRSFLFRFIQTASPVPLQIQRDVGVSKLLERSGHAKKGFVLEKPGNFSHPHFDAGQVAWGVGSRGSGRELPLAARRDIRRCTACAQLMVPNAHIVKSKIAQHILCRLDHSQFLFGNRFAVGNPRTQTSHLRLL